MGFMDKVGKIFHREQRDDLSFLDEPTQEPLPHHQAPGTGPDPLGHGMGGADPLAHRDPMPQQGHLNSSLPPTQQSFGKPDHRMNMPLGDSLRSQNRQSMYEEVPKKEQQAHHNPLEKDLEIISSKLDYLRASLDSINQRLVNVEHMVRDDMNSKQWKR